VQKGGGTLLLWAMGTPSNTVQCTVHFLPGKWQKIVNKFIAHKRLSSFLKMVVINRAIIIFFKYSMFMENLNDRL
jgi:hypothetical protein